MSLLVVTYADNWRARIQRDDDDDDRDETAAGTFCDAYRNCAESHGRFNYLNAISRADTRSGRIPREFRVTVVSLLISIFTRGA